jgi:hypothetical protein
MCISWYFHIQDLHNLQYLLARHIRKSISPNYGRYLFEGKETVLGQGRGGG